MRKKNKNICSMFKVRVCDGCYATLQKPSSGTLKRNEGPNDLPAEYLNSSLAQQSQVCITHTHTTQ